MIFASADCSAAFGRTESCVQLLRGSELCSISCARSTEGLKISIRCPNIEGCRDTVLFGEYQK
jgi:hypothetical protein